MRLAGVPLFYWKRPDLAVNYAGQSTQLTHADRKAIDASRYYSALIVGAIQGMSKEQLLHRNFYERNRIWFGEDPLHEEILNVAQGSFKKSDGYEGGIRGKGYVVNSLEAVLWAFWSDENSFEKGVLLAVNLGDDTDTTAAIYGQLAGAYYGYEQIPLEWRDKLYARDLIRSIGEWLEFLGFQFDEMSTGKPSLSRSISHDPNTNSTLRATPSNFRSPYNDSMSNRSQFYYRKTNS